MNDDSSKQSFDSWQKEADATLDKAAEKSTSFTREQMRQASGIKDQWEELKGIQTLKLEWRGKAQLQIKFSPTEFYNKLLDQRIYECLNSNYNRPGWLQYIFSCTKQECSY